MDSTYRINQRLLIIDYDHPISDFQGIKSGISFNGDIVYFEGGVLSTLSRNGTVSKLPSSAHTEESIVLGRSPIPDGGNISIGNRAMKQSSVLGDSVAIGDGSMGECGRTECNIGIGRDSLSKVSDSYNIAVGIEAGKNLSGMLANHNIALGRESMKNAQPSLINVSAIGTRSCAEIKGTNFQSVYLGDHSAEYLESPLLSTNNVGAGSSVFRHARDISDCVGLGSHAGETAIGCKAVMIGANTLLGFSGSLSGDTLIGYEAGSFRKYDNSKNIFIGFGAGSTGSGAECIGFGSCAGGNQIGSYNLSFGYFAGQHLTGSSNLSFGREAGHGLVGDGNISMGSRSGTSVSGSRNIMLGENYHIGDVLDDAILIGPNIFAKGKGCIILGANAGQYSQGYLVNDIIIGAGAGQGQSFSENISESKNLLIIGAFAGVGNTSIPSESSESVILGHFAGQSPDQIFSKSVMMGNYAGSFAETVIESVFVGHSAAIASSGCRNVYVGAFAGFNVVGSRNIFIGAHMGDYAGSIENHIDDRLAIGTGKIPSIIGDLKNNNLSLGGKLSSKDWTDAKNSLAFTETKRPTFVDGVDGVLHASNSQLEYSTPETSSVLSFPYRFYHRGELNGYSIPVEMSRNESSLLNIRIIPFTRPELYVDTKILLTVSQNQASLSVASVGPFDFDVIDGRFTIHTARSTTGLVYLECIGEGIRHI